MHTNLVLPGLNWISKLVRKLVPGHEDLRTQQNVVITFDSCDWFPKFLPVLFSDRPPSCVLLSRTFFFSLGCQNLADYTSPIPVASLVYLLTSCKTSLDQPKERISDIADLLGMSNLPKSLIVDDGYCNQIKG